MKFLTIASALLLIIFLSCKKEIQQDFKEKIDSASRTLGRDLDTLMNAALYNDSLYDNAPVEKIDTISLASKTFRKKLNGIFDEYSDIKDELVDDDTSGVIKQAEEFSRTLTKVQSEGASESPGTKWKLWVSSAEKIIADLKNTENLAKQRKIFADLSLTMETMIKSMGLNDKIVYKLFCSNVKEKNNFWLTDSKNNKNPYYGKDKANEKSKPCIEILKAFKFD